MSKQAVLNHLDEVLTLVFLSVGPALGAVIAIVWLVGCVLGLVAALGR